MKIEPATPEKLRDLKARSGYRVSFALQPDVPEGTFTEWIDLAGKATGASSAAATASYRMDIRCRVEGRISFYGPKVVDRNVLQLGTQQRGATAHASMFLKVNDPQRQLSVMSVESTPAFLKVHLTPFKSGAKNNGLYRVDVDIPSDAPSCAFVSDKRGVVRVKNRPP